MLAPIMFEDKDTCQTGVAIESAHEERVTKVVEASRRNSDVRHVSISKSWLFKEPS